MADRDINVTLGDSRDYTLEIKDIRFVQHAARHEEGGSDEIDLDKLAINGDLDLESFDLVDNAQIIWDSGAQEIPDSALGQIENATLAAIQNTALANDSVTITAGDGLKDGGTVALGDSITVNVEPADFAGTYLSDDGSDNLTVNLGFALENDGSGNIRFDEDANLNLTGTVDVPADTFDAVEVDIGRGLEDDGTGAIQFDEDTEYTFTVDQNFGSSVNLSSSGSIQDAGIDAIQFDGSQNVEIPNGDLNIGGGINFIDDFAAISNLYKFDLVNPGFDSGDFFTISSKSSGEIAVEFSDDSAGTLTSVIEFNDDNTVEIPNGSLELNKNSINEVQSIEFFGSTSTNPWTITENVSDNLLYEYDGNIVSFFANDGFHSRERIITQPSAGDLTDGGAINSPSFRLTGYYDSDGTAGINATEVNADIAHNVSATGDSDISFTIDSTEIARFSSNQRRSFFEGRIDVAESSSAGGVGLSVENGITILKNGLRVDEITDEDNTASQLNLVGGQFRTDGLTNVSLYDSANSQDILRANEGGLVEIPSGNLDLNSNNLINLATPSNPNDGATKQYVDNNVQGATDIKESVRASSTGNIDLASATDPNPVDGVTLSNGDRVLLQDQTDATENGIYSAVTATDPTTWTRTTDADEDVEFTSGLFVFVEEGTSRGNSSYIVTTPDPITLGVTSINFAQFSSAGEISAGDGLDKTGQTLSVDVSDFAGTFLSDDGGNDLTVDVGTGLENDGGGNIRVDEDFDFTFTSEIDFDAGLVVSDDITDSFGTTIWSSFLGEIPDAAMGSIDNATLTNSSVTINANDGLVGGGSVSLGGSVGLDIEPADFAGTFLSDDGADNLTVDIGRGLENDGADNIQFDEDTEYTFTVDQNFGSNVNLSASGSIQDAGTDAIQFDGSQNVTIPNGELTVNSGGAGATNTGINVTSTDAISTIGFADNTTTQPVQIGAQGDDVYFRLGNGLQPISILNTGELELSGADINFSNSNSIQDAGTDAITFDGSQNVTIPNGNLDLSANTLQNTDSIEGDGDGNLVIDVQGTNPLLNLRSNDRMGLPQVTADPSASAGDLWYRTDLD